MLARALSRGNRCHIKCCHTRSLSAARHRVSVFKHTWQISAVPGHQEPHEQVQHQPGDSLQPAAEVDGGQLQSTPASAASEPTAAADIAAAAAAAVDASTAAEDASSNPATPSSSSSSSSSHAENGRDIIAVQAGRMLSIVALGLTVAGLAVGTWAQPIAAACLKLGSSTSSTSSIATVLQPQAAAMVGCCGAAVLRAASLAWFVAVSAHLILPHSPCWPPGFLLSWSHAIRQW